eukprot:CAMPEP_0181060258 /NCGR_PEP_ID=MMETSP1070-20121207/21859_1 /TAXON_ID=265543 /ORGANISM="Minutocellus polymorphus, Strain NH13" /LENGTH=40 /DNA_ID= /DNA_START= /DNA_END= /DNA_ORIENTATION=
MHMCESSGLHSSRSSFCSALRALATTSFAVSPPGYPASAS